MKKIKGTDFIFVKEVEPKIRPNGSLRRLALFRCLCGSEKIRDYSVITGKYAKSCFQCSKKRISKSRLTHGLTDHPLYKKWSDIKKRCYNENVDRYSNYGGLGIGVCKEWRYDFKSFYDWSINNGWSKGLTIDRINNEKDYSPSNCRYITMLEQGFNKRNTFFVCIDNCYKIGLSELLHKNNKSKLYKTIWAGLKLGVEIDFYIKKYNLSLDYDFISKKRNDF